MMFNLAPVPVPDLSGRVVLVSGAAKGIGAETARVLAERGARVFASGLGGAPDEPLPAEVTWLSLDVTSQAETDAAFARIERDAGRLDAVVNNAGIINPIGPLASLPAAALAGAFSVNVMGVHRVSMAALPMLEASGGRIVNAGTGAATTAMEGWTVYCTTKAAMRMLTQMMDLELKPRGVRSFFLGIPPTDTAMQAEIRASGLNPISQIPQADLVPARVPASCLAWLCSKEAQEVGDILLDVRQERFTAMMDLPAPA